MTLSRVLEKATLVMNASAPFDGRPSRLTGCAKGRSIGGMQETLFRATRASHSVSTLSRSPRSRVSRFLAALIRAASSSDRETRDRVSSPRRSRPRCDFPRDSSLSRAWNERSAAEYRCASIRSLLAAPNSHFHFYPVKTLDEYRVMLRRRDLLAQLI